MSAPVLMLGLDATEHTLIDSLIARGRLPTLARLRTQGAYGLLDSPADLYSGAVWPTFYSGRRVPWHGLYHNKLWRPARMCCAVPDERAFRAQPFWESCAEARLRTCIVDVPLLSGRTRGTDGLYLNGWATHDSAPTDSQPSDLRRRLQREFGRRAMPPESFGPQTIGDLEQLHGELLRATEQFARVARALLQRGAWNLACVVFGTAHRAGHYLWDLQQARDAAQTRDAERGRLAASIERIYEALDAALAEVLAAIDKDARVIVFSLHGMGPNGGWSEIVPAMLDAWRASVGAPAAKPGALYALRRALAGAARPFLKRIPPALAAQLVPLWSARMFDWRRTRVFPLPMDLTGLLRINLRGREREGIVAPGEEYEALCAQLEALFLSLRDAGSGRAIVADIIRDYQRTPDEAPCKDGLPDLIVRWGALRSSEVRAVTSSVLPSYRCCVPRWLPSGRSGNHLPTGWIIAKGSGIARGARLDGHHILDIAPTVRSLLGLPPDPALDGRPMPLGDP